MTTLRARPYSKRLHRVVTLKGWQNYKATQVKLLLRRCVQRSVAVHHTLVAMMTTTTTAAGTGSARTAEVQEGTAVEAEALTGDILLLVPEADLEVADMVNHPEEDYLTLRQCHHQLIESSLKNTTFGQSRSFLYDDNFY